MNENKFHVNLKEYWSQFKKLFSLLVHYKREFLDKVSNNENAMIKKIKNKQNHG